MAHIRKRRGKRRAVGSIVIKENGKIIHREEKWFPSASKNDLRKAEAWELEAREKLREERETERTRLASWNLLDWANEYLKFSQSNYADKTFREKQSVFKNLIGHFSPNIWLADMDSSDAYEFLYSCFESKGGNVANKARKNLSAAWEWGKGALKHFPESDSLAINPFQVVKKFPEIRHPRYIPPLDDFWIIFDQLDNLQDETMMLTFLHTAGRRSEIFNLKFSDLDFHSGRIRLWTRKRKNGSMEYDWIPMTTELSEKLQSWRKERLMMRVGDKEHVFVCLEQTPFCVEYYGQPFMKRQHFLKRLCKRAKIKPFGFHSIRHLTATELFIKGYDLWIIQTIMRHKSPTTTIRYLHKQGLTPARQALEASLKRECRVIDFPQKKASGSAESEGL